MEILNPLEQFLDEFAPKFAEAAENEFEGISSKATVDVAANRKTCDAIYSAEKEVSSATKKINIIKVVCIVLLVISGILLLISLLSRASGIAKTIMVCLAIISILVIYFKLNPTVTKLKKEKVYLETEIEKLKKEAWRQMSSFNDAIDEYTFVKLFSGVIPSFSFQPYLTESGYQKLKSYNCPDVNSEQSVVALQSGHINGFPFVIRRIKEFHMGQRAYHGSKKVTVTKTEYRDGRDVCVTKEETLDVEIVKPFPEFPVVTEVVYGHDAAPQLTFNRKKNKFKNQVGSISYNFNKLLLKKKSQNMKKDFAMMTNEEFEVIFTTSDRNNNQQFALLFTPIAQANMKELIRDTEVGFGDDFNFCKDRKINIVTAEHMKAINMEWSAAMLKSFDYALAHETFVDQSLQLFRSVYFGFAPLLCIPLYQQMEPSGNATSARANPKACKWEHESFANFLGDDEFKHPSCATECILKTEERMFDEYHSRIDVTAYGFEKIPRVENVEARSSDGRTHYVPVEWDEYLPVEGEGHFDLDRCEAPSREGYRRGHIAS